MKTILLVFIGIMLFNFYKNGFSDFEYDYIAQRDFPTRWYKIKIVKEWNETLKDEYGKKILVYYKRPFKKYVLEYELISSSRLNRHFEDIYTVLTK